MFYRCSSLSYLPDLSKWNTSKVKDMIDLLYGCFSLSYLPDISFGNYFRSDIISNCINCINGENIDEPKSLSFFDTFTNQMENDSYNYFNFFPPFFE